jgi:hypothetical protein
LALQHIRHTVSLAFLALGSGLVYFSLANEPFSLDRVAPTAQQRYGKNAAP